MIAEKKLNIILVILLIGGVLFNVVTIGILVFKKNIAYANPECAIADNLKVPGGFNIQANDINSASGDHMTITPGDGSGPNQYLQIGYWGNPKDLHVTGNLTVEGNANLDINPSCTTATSNNTGPEHVVAGASCPAGKSLTGGGCNCTEANPNEVAVQRSAKGVMANTWECVCQRVNGGSGDITATAEAVCCF